MTLRLSILGFTIAALEVDVPAGTVSPVDHGVKHVSAWWTRRMIR